MTSGLFETVTGAVMVVGAATAMVLLDPLLFGVTLSGIVVGLTGASSSPAGCAGASRACAGSASAR